MKFALETLARLKEVTQQLSQGLLNLTISDNFNSQSNQVVISPGQEIEIRNRLKFIPNAYIIRYQVGNGNVTASSTLWTRNNLYMFNHGPDEVTATISFWKE